MFTGIASITTNSFAINVDVTDTSVGFLSARIQCSLAAAGFFPPLFLKGLRTLLLEEGGARRLYTQLIWCGKGISSFKCNDP